MNNRVIAPGSCDRKESILQTITTSRRAALYARVSTRNGQTSENQIGAMCEVAARKGWEIVDQYVDYSVSGAKGRDQRPEFDRLLKDATRRKFDVLMAWSVDRLGRSLQDLVSFLSRFARADSRPEPAGHEAARVTAAPPHAPGIHVGQPELTVRVIE